MNKLKDLLVTDNYTKQQLRQVYPVITTTKFNDEELRLIVQKVLPSLYKFISEGFIHRDCLLLSALGNDDGAILQKFVEYETNLPLDIHNGMSLFTYCYYKKKHWFQDVIEGQELIVEFSAELQNDINVLKLIKHSNQLELNIDIVQNLISVVHPNKYESYDSFIVQYVDEIDYIVKVLIYCKENCDTAPDRIRLFNDICTDRLLGVFDKYLDLKKDELWMDVCAMLILEEGRSLSNSEFATPDSDHFKNFIILADIINALKQVKKGPDSNGNVQLIMLHALDILRMLSNRMQINVLQDIFALCFLKWKHLYPNISDNRQDEFFCADKELQLLLHFLKPCIDELIAKTPIRSQETGCLQKLNRYIKEALWRLDMLEDMETFDMRHMLADAETLIRRSFRHGWFDKVHQVIQLFNLEETDIAKVVIYTERLYEFKTQLQQAFRLQALQRDMPHIQQPFPAIVPKRIIESFIEKNEVDHSLLADVAFVITICYENADTTIDCIDFAPNHLAKFEALHNAIPNATFLDILINPNYCNSPNEYLRRVQYYSDVDYSIQAFYSQLNETAFDEQGKSESHLVHRSYAALKQLAGFKDMNEVSYFLRLFNYLKIFLRVFTIEANNSDIIAREPSGFISYFDILKRSPADWIGVLMRERSLDPSDLEHLFSRLKLDILYCTTANSFPNIRLTNYQYIVRKLFPPTNIVFNYIAKRNWLLAFLVGKLFNLKKMDVNESRTKYFSQYVNTPEVDSLKILFNDNKIIAALNQDFYELCIDYLNKNIFETEMHSNNVEEAEEVSEDDPRCNWMHLLLLIDSIPEVRVNEQINILRDRILSNLVADIFEVKSYMYVRYVKDDNTRRNLIMTHFSTWPGEFTIHLLRNEKDEELQHWADLIQFCETTKNILEFRSWFEVHDLCTAIPSVVFERLILIPDAALLLDFQRFYRCDSLLDELPIEYISSLFDHNEDLGKIRTLIDYLANPIEACLSLVQFVKNLNQLDFLIHHLKELNYSDESYIKNMLISTKILGSFNVLERDNLWCLIANPLAIIEMLIMNMKLDKLGVILNIIRTDLSNCEFNDNVISLEAIDELLRSYAEKSLEFRVILNPHPSLLKGSDVKLMESLDSIYGPDKKSFNMPEKTPAKAEWTPNNEVIECMCCHNTVFSMFNRRHHCRRCGRVICFNCSTKRMRVPSYDDILVRVCIDCYNQSQTDEKSDSMSNKSIVYDQWFLSDSNDHNAIVRQEFSYEHAPSVSLCLSIMKHHTKTEAYPKFLLNQCDAMLKLLQPPVPNGPQEVDYMLVIKMLKALAIAAKMLSADCQLQWGSSQADRILSQADLFALLAERGCLNLLPPSSSGAPYVDGFILRKLRDKLLMQEQWHFALDVSTKAGLDNTGVFAAWGKSCLKAGCLQMAREKFQRCLEKGHYDSISLGDEDAIETSTRSRYSRTSLSSDVKPSKNPAILDQIIDILENQTTKFPKNNSSRSTSEKDCAILIKAKLRNLKAIANGNFESRITQKENVGTTLDPQYFQECLYYLKKYGSHLGCLEFYIRHNCIKQALIYMYDNKVSVDIFVEIYMICLRDGQIEQLQKCMSRIDSTLEIWKEYLRGICRHLEKQGLLNSLYQLQQFMVDFVRAAMTCIRFYKDQALSYEELATRIHFLDKAEAHLLQELEQQQWIEVNEVVNSVSCDSSYEEKPALSNPHLVMKMDLRIIDQHIRTIKRQIEITNFLSQYAKSNLQFVQKLPQMTPTIEGENINLLQKHLPTLFDSHTERTQLAVMLITCGESVQDGYEIAHGIIQDYKLKALKVYCQAGRQLAREDRYAEIAELVNCIRSKGSNVPAVNSICDEMLTLAVRTLSRNNVPVAQLESLIKLITDRATKISIYIETKQLKSAYLLAAKYNRFGDIRRILREAELINKQDIKKLCQKLLQVHSHSKD